MNQEEKDIEMLDSMVGFALPTKIYRMMHMSDKEMAYVEYSLRDILEGHPSYIMVTLAETSLELIIKKDSLDMKTMGITTYESCAGFVIGRGGRAIKTTIARIKEMYPESKLQRINVKSVSFDARVITFKLESFIEYLLTRKMASTDEYI